MRRLKIVKQVTKRDSLSLDKYFHEISNQKLLSAEEEFDLVCRMNKGDQEAQNKLIKANLRFVVSVAKRYQNRGLSLSDLISEGNIGLISAAQRFDETRGFKFISYAVWWIRQSILQALAEKSRPVRLPLNRQGGMNLIKKTIERITQESGIPPSIEEIAQQLNKPENWVEQILVGVDNHYFFLDDPTRNGDDVNLNEVIEDLEALSPDQNLIHYSLRIEVSRVLSTLNEKEEQVIQLCYGLSGDKQHSLNEISEIMNVSRERVRQIKEKAIKRLKEKKHLELLRPYLS
ncbi:sigma-70 family RNA polymerase sigma factor [Sunxiuqinia elliptica]